MGTGARALDGFDEGIGACLWSPRTDSLQCVCSHGVELSRIGEDISQQRRQSVGIAARVDVTGFTVRDEVAYCADSIAGDNGAAAEHCLVDDQAEWFVARRDDHQVGSFVEGGKPGLIDETEEANFVGDPALSGSFF